MGQSATATQLAAETQELYSDVVKASGLTWANVASVVENGYNAFISEVNPIGSAEAASAATPTSQQSANRVTAQSALNQPNVLAFIHTISAGENNGTYQASNYHAEYGGNVAPNLSSFPTNQRFAGFSASGAYQFVWVTWNELQHQLGLTDFSATSQDLAVAYKLFTTGALGALEGGDFAKAIFLSSKVWSTIPEGSGTLDHSYTPGANATTYATFINRYHTYGGTGP